MPPSTQPLRSIHSQATHQLLTYIIHQNQVQCSRELHEFTTRNGLSHHHLEIKEPFTQIAALVK